MTLTRETLVAPRPDVDIAGVLQAAMGTVPVLVPWRPDGGARDANWELVREALWSGWSHVTLGASPDGPFNRSAAINDAYAAAPPSDVVIVADADSIVDPTQLGHAIHVARATGQLTIAHDRWVNIEDHERAAFLAGDPINEKRVTARDPRSFAGRRVVWKGTVSSMLVVPTALWEQVGGFDDRFVGWGFEDRAFHRVCDAIGGGHQRIPGPCWHLDHARPSADVNRQRDRGYKANRELWYAYRRAVDFRVRP